MNVRIKSCFSSIVDYTARAWPSVIFVSSLAVVLHLHGDRLWAQWFDVIDKYSYVAIGNIAAFRGAGSNSDPGLPEPVVLAIDEETHTKQYGERSPLDRCTLLEHLGRVYASKPKLVVIDLDLSPELFPDPSPTPSKADRRDRDKEYNCRWGDERGQQKLNALITQKVRRERIPTVVVAPFGNDWEGDTKDWVRDMEKAGVRFGRAELKNEYGMVLRSYDDPCTLARVAADTYKRTNNPQQAEKNGIEECKAGPAELDKYVLNKKKTTVVDFSNLPVYPDKVKGKVQLVNLKDWLDPCPKANSVAPKKRLDSCAESPGLHGKVVFFGGKYGFDDRHLTVSGMRYGVDVHAAAFLSSVHEADGFWGHLWEYGIDVAFALISGVVFAGCWHGYFHMHSSDDPSRRQLASLCLMVLAGLVGVWVGLLLRASLWLYTNRGYWMSPVPIAFGMLVDSLILGSVEEAKELLEKPLREAKDCSGEIRPKERKWSWIPVRLWICLRRLGWFGVVGWALCSMSR